MLPDFSSAVRLVASIGLALLGAQAAAQTATTEILSDLQEAPPGQAERIERLESRVSELEAELARLLAEEKESAPQAAPEPASAPDDQVRGTGASDGPAISDVKWKGGPEFVSASGDYSIKLRGRLQSDAWLVTNDPDDRNYPSGTEIRAVRMGVQGQLGPVLSYAAEADFSGNSVTLKSAYVQYQGSPSWALQAGNLKPHVSLENKTGLPQNTFMERSLPNIFAISDEVLGLAFISNGRKWSFGAGPFGEGPGTHIEGNEGYGLAARFTHAPLLDGDKVVHLGVSGYHKQLGSDAGANFRLRQRPETHLFETRLLDTSTLPADSSSVFGLEFASAIGAFSLQAEYLRNQVDHDAPGTVEFDGAYAYLSWFATGESRPYSGSSGRFGGVAPDNPLGNGGWGALEWALRYSTVDLNDGLVLGGKEQNITLGANWYLSEYARLAFNWVHFDVEDSAATMPFGLASHKGNAFGVRAQMTW